ncbi:MAG: DUF488 domain-containing protein [Chitinispirillaceae bacterium]|jgi:uncharacterized protein YeaO (DUF488 family)
MLTLKRIYSPPSKTDGHRILVDRLWPRGVSKEKAKIDLWLKEIAPSDSLRKWFLHDPKKWDGFRTKYGLELDTKPGLLRTIKQIEKEEKTVTLLYSAKDERRNNAVVLKEKLEK